MLDFFVLGEIPGTNMVITFSWVLIAGAILLGFGQATIFYNRYKLSIVTTQDNAQKSKTKTRQSAK